MSGARNIATILNTNNEINENKTITNTLDDLIDVDLSNSPINGDSLSFDTSVLKWLPAELYIPDFSSYSTKNNLNQVKTNFIDGAPEELDTIGEISRILTEDELGISELLSYVSRVKTIIFVADGTTKKFNINHISGNVDVWLNGILQTPNITDSTDILGERTSTIDLNAFHKEFDFDYYSTDDTFGFNNADELTDIEPGDFTFLYSYRQTDGSFHYSIDISDFNEHPYPNSSTILSSPIYEITNSGATPSDPAYYYFLDGRLTNRRDPEYYFGSTLSINLNNPITFNKIYTRESYQTIINVAKQSSSFIHFTFTPEYGDIIKVRVY